MSFALDVLFALGILGFVSVMFAGLTGDDAPMFFGVTSIVVSTVGGWVLGLILRRQVNAKRAEKAMLREQVERAKLARRISTPGGEA